jgi:hypothetical protein
VKIDCNSLCVRALATEDGFVTLFLDFRGNVRSAQP